MAFTFGSKERDYVPVTIDPDDIWIKGFKTGDTKIRLLEEKGDWFTYREHFDPVERKSFPCLEDATCKGCQSTIDRVKKQTRKWAFNALDAEGRLNVYKIGAKLKKKFERREERYETLMDRDYVVVRSGTTMEDTDYDAEAQERSTCDWDGEMHDIKQILTGQYLQYLEALSGGDGETDKVHDEPVAKKTKAAEKTVKDEKTDEDPEDWALSKLKAYLDNEKIDFPLRASREQLIPLVKKALLPF